MDLHGKRLEGRPASGERYAKIDDIKMCSTMVLAVDTVSEKVRRYRETHAFVSANTGMNTIREYDEIHGGKCRRKTFDFMYKA